MAKKITAGKADEADDDLDALMSDIDAAFKKGGIDAVTKAAMKHIDDDETAPHEVDFGDDDNDEPPPQKAKAGKKTGGKKQQQEDDGEEETAEEFGKSRLQKKLEKAKAGEEVEEDDDTEEAEEDDEEESDAEPGEDSESESDEEDSRDESEDGEEQSADSDDSDESEDGSAGANKNGGLGSGPKAKALAAAGWDAAGLSEEQADYILKNFAGAQQQPQQRDPLAKIGEALLASLTPDKIRSLMGGERQAEKKETGTDPVAERKAALLRLASASEKYKKLSAKPDYDPTWESSGVQYANGRYFAPPNRPDLNDIAAKLNEHRKWQTDRLSILEDLPDVLEATTRALSVETPAGMDETKVAALLGQATATAMKNEVAKKIATESAPWMFMRKPDGGYVRDASGNLVFTPEGVKYDAMFTLLVNRGQKNETAEDLQILHNMAFVLANPKVEKKGGKQGGSGVEGGNASGRNGSSDEETPAEKAARLKERGKEKAVGKSGKNKAGIPNKKRRSEDDGDADRAARIKRSEKQTLEDQFRDELREAGITDSTLTFGD